MEWKCSSFCSVMHARPHSRAGVNMKGFNFKLAMVKTCSTWPLLKNTPFKKNTVVLTPQMMHRHLRLHPLYGPGPDQKLKSEFYFCSDQNLFRLVAWKEPQRHSMENLNGFALCPGFMFSTAGSQMWQYHFWPKTAIWDWTRPWGL